MAFVWVKKVALATSWQNVRSICSNYSYVISSTVPWHNIKYLEYVQIKKQPAQHKICVKQFQFAIVFSHSCVGSWPAFNIFKAARFKSGAETLRSQLLSDGSSVLLPKNLLSVVSRIFQFLSKWVWHFQGWVTRFKVAGDSKYSPLMPYESCLSGNFVVCITIA